MVLLSRKKNCCYFESKLQQCAVESLMTNQTRKQCLYKKSWPDTGTVCKLFATGSSTLHRKDELDDRSVDETVNDISFLFVPLGCKADTNLYCLRLSILSTLRFVASQKLSRTIAKPFVLRSGLLFLLHLARNIARIHAKKLGFNRAEAMRITMSTFYFIVESWNNHTCSDALPGVWLLKATMFLQEIFHI